MRRTGRYSIRSVRAARVAHGSSARMPDRSERESSTWCARAGGGRDERCERSKRKRRERAAERGQGGTERENERLVRERSVPFVRQGRAGERSLREPHRCVKRAMRSSMGDASI